MAEIVYTRYEASDLHADFSDDWLEETNEGRLKQETIELARKIDPKSVRDKDGDGYREINKSVLQKIVEAANVNAAFFPLASYFADKKSPSAAVDRLVGLSEPLKQAVPENNFAAAGEYFAFAASNVDNPLKTVALPLAQYLAAQLMHSGLNLDDSVRLDTPAGFSVHGSGRLRVDCVLFAELGHKVLEDIPGLTFQYISLKSRDNPLTSDVTRAAARETLYYEFETPESVDDPSGSGGSHLILMVVDEEKHHLIIDNHSVRYFFSEDSLAFFKGIYRDEYREYCVKDSSIAACVAINGWIGMMSDYRPF